MQLEVQVLNALMKLIVVSMKKVKISPFIGNNS